MPWLKHAMILAMLAALASPALAEGNSPYPSPAMAWTKEEYSAFYFAHYNTHLALPHLRDAENRKLFERLTARENIEGIIAHAPSPEAAVSDLRIVLGSLGGIRSSYNYAVQLGEPLQEELVRFQDFMLYTASALCELSGDRPPDQALASSMKTIVLGIFFSLSESAVYTQGQIAALSDTLARRFHFFAPLFPEDERKDLIIHVERLESAATGDSARIALARLRQTIASF